MQPMQGGTCQLRTKKKEKDTWCQNRAIDNHQLVWLCGSYEIRMKYNIINTFIRIYSQASTELSCWQDHYPICATSSRPDNKKSGQSESGMEAGEALPVHFAHTLSNFLKQPCWHMYPSYKQTATTLTYN